MAVRKRGPKRTFWPPQRSGILPPRRLDQKALRYVAKQRGKKSASVVASEMGISERRIYRIWAHHRKTGSVPEYKGAGRPPIKPTGTDVLCVLEEYSKGPDGAVQVAKRMRSKGSKISYHMVYRIMKDENLVGKTGGRSKRRKWVRYERRYSNAMWHVDWHMIKGGSPLRGMWLITYLDDASRCITGYNVFEEATATNSILSLRSAVKRFGVPAQILSDHGSQFTAIRKKGSKRKPRPTEFGQELAGLGITHVKARVGHPQTNGKLERFFGTFESKWEHFEDVEKFMSYYNEYRLHFSLDMDAGETPRRAFSNKRATKAIRKSNPKWYEEDLNQALP